MEQLRFCTGEVVDEDSVLRRAELAMEKLQGDKEKLIRVLLKAMKYHGQMTFLGRDGDKELYCELRDVLREVN